MASPQDVPDFDKFEVGSVQVRANYTVRKPQSQQGDLNDEWYEQRHRRGAWGNPRRITAREFILRYPMIEDNRDADKEWGPVRLLGKGGFGLVGLWEKRDNDNKAVDRVAIKQAKVLEDKSLYLGDSPPLLLKEAVVHHDLNTKNADAFPWLRRYKYQPVQPALATRFRVPDAQRMYLEFCEHGDLDGLRSKYRLWDQYLPELFLWRLFYQLAVAGDALHEPPPPNSRVLKHILQNRPYADQRNQELVNARQERQRLNKTTPEGVRNKEAEKLEQIQLVTEQVHYDRSVEKRQYPFQHYSTVHFDMKPSNVLLADTDWQGKQSLQHQQQLQQQAAEPDDDSDQSESQDPSETRPAKRRRTARKTVSDKEQPDRGDLDSPDYPLAKMSDFGLAQYTNYFHHANPDLFWRCGTAAFQGPVSQTLSIRLDVANTIHCPRVSIYRLLTECTFSQEQIGYGANWNMPPTGAMVRSVRWGANGQTENVDANTAYHNQMNDAQRDIVFDHSLNVSLQRGCLSLSSFICFSALPEVVDIPPLTREFPLHLDLRDWANHVRDGDAGRRLRPARERGPILRRQAGSRRPSVQGLLPPPDPACGHQDPQDVQPTAAAPDLALHRPESRQPTVAARAA